MSALCHGTLGALLGRLPNARVTILDFGRNARSDRVRVGDTGFPVERCGASHSRRLYRSDTLWNIRLSARLGGLWNPAARRLLEADVVLDISGGDSFTDLYGRKRFESVVYAKRIALENGIPLILLPQTYGPFKSQGSHATAAGIVRACRLALARDDASSTILQELAGDAFEPDRHRRGVDVAFLLEARPPRAPVPEPIGTWIMSGRHEPVVGFNVSGLVYHDPRAARSRFGLHADYRRAVIEILSRLLGEGVRVVLVPHVLTPPGHYESDVAAAEAVRAALPPVVHSRVAVLPALYDQSEVKWLIARLEWFCGTRMHATIAALSSGVPAASIAYSGKTAGVFETCAQGDEVVDARSLDTQGVVERVWSAWQRRERCRAALARRLPEVVGRAQEQMDLVASAILATARSRGYR